MNDTHPPPPCSRCSAPLPAAASFCPACGAPVGPPPAALTEQYREGERLLRSGPLRAVSLLPVAIPALVVGMVVVTQLVPRRLEDAVGDIFGAIVAIVVLAIIGAALFVSAKSAAKGGLFHVLPYALPAAGIALCLSAQVAPRPLVPVLQVIGSGCLMLSIPAVLLSTALRGRAASAPARIDGATIQQAAEALRGSLAAAVRAPGPATAPPAPFDEHPEARRARLEQLRARNGMLRAARVNIAPFVALGKLMLAAFPAIMLFVAALGVVTVARGVLTGRLPPKSSMGDGVMMAVFGVTVAFAFHRLVLAPHRVLAKRVARVAAHVQSRAIANSATAMLEWLDRSWSDSVPSSGPASWGWHWIVPFTFRGRPALLSVLDDVGGRSAPHVRRIDVFLACPCAAPLLDADAAARARALGFEPVQSPAGVRFERRDLAPAAVAPEILDALLQLPRLP